MLIVAGTIECDPANHDALAALAATLSSASMAEDGCAAHGFWADPATPGRFLIFEEWESAEANAAHSSTPHLAEFMGALGTVGVKSARLDRYDVSAKSKLM